MIHARILFLGLALSGMVACTDADPAPTTEAAAAGGEPICMNVCSFDGPCDVTCRPLDLPPIFAEPVLVLREPAAACEGHVKNTCNDGCCDPDEADYFGDYCGSDCFVAGMRLEKDGDSLKLSIENKAKLRFSKYGYTPIDSCQ